MTQQFGWIVHGLWSQNEQARRVSDHLRFCQGDLPKLPQELIEQYLPEMPGANLIQGEWEKHGSCMFNNAQDYLEKIKNLYRTLKLPNYELSRNELFTWIKKNNPQLKGRYLGAARNELFICYGLDWQPIDCPRNRTGY